MSCPEGFTVVPILHQQRIDRVGCLANLSHHPALNVPLSMNLDIQRGKTISRFVEACREGNLSLVRRVYHKHNNPSILRAYCPLTQLSGLHAAAEFDRLHVVQWYIQTHPAPVDIINVRCNHVNVHATPLHYAARAGRHDVIAWMLKNPIVLADKHPLDDQGLEPVDWCLERRRDHVEYLFRDLATKPLRLTLDPINSGRHRHMKANEFGRDDDDEKGEEVEEQEESKSGGVVQHEWYKRAQGVYVSAQANALHPTWSPPLHLGGLPLLGYNVYCRRLRTYIPPLDQTIEGRDQERVRMRQVRRHQVSELMIHEAHVGVYLGVLTTLYKYTRSGHDGRCN